jgi:hypothetical protein
MEFMRPERNGILRTRQAPAATITTLSPHRDTMHRADYRPWATNDSKSNAFNQSGT